MGVFEGGRALLKDTGRSSHLSVRNRMGSIATRWTYGERPDLPCGYYCGYLAGQMFKQLKNT
jgi:hypothetical protein